MPVIPFPSESVFNSATFMYGHIVLTTIRNFSNLHLKNYSAFSSFFILLLFIYYIQCSCDRHLGMYYVSVFDPIVL